MKLHIRVKLGINFMRTNEGKCIRFDKVYDYLFNFFFLLDT